MREYKLYKMDREKFICKNYNNSLQFLDTHSENSYDFNS